MLTLLGLFIGRPLHIGSGRSASSAARRIRARVELPSDHSAQHQRICGDVSGERIALACIDPEESDWFAPLLVGKLIPETDSGSGGGASSPSDFASTGGDRSHFEGSLRFGVVMRYGVPAVLLLVAWLVLHSLPLLVLSPSAHAVVPLLLGVPVAVALWIAFGMVNERAKRDAAQLEQLLRESLEAPIAPREKPRSQDHSDPPTKRTDPNRKRLETAGHAA